VNSKFWLKFLILIIIVFLLVIISAKIYPTKIVNEGAPLSSFTSHLDKRIPTLMEDYKIPGINIALIKNGEKVWTKAYGYANLSKKEKMTNTTICRVESISKPVTVWGVMNLVEEGKIKLDEPVMDNIYNWDFPDTKFSVEKITPRLLLSNSAGLPLGTIGEEALYSPGEKMPSLEELLTEEAVLMWEPAQKFSYSDTGFNLLELLIEEATARDFSEYMEAEILKPLRMDNSAYTINTSWAAEVPLGYDINGNPVPVYTYAMKASGNLYSTVGDIANFMIAGMSTSSRKNNVLASQSINEIYSPVLSIPGYYGIVFDSYGLGHFIEQLPDGRFAVSHGGQGTGWMTHFHSVPETGDGIVILANSQRSWPPFAYILSDWGHWSGNFSVGMTKIILAQKLVWIIIGLLFFILFWQFWSIVEGIVTSRRKFYPLSKSSRSLRLVQFILFIIFSLSFLWIINLEYFFLASVFPIAYNWLFYSIIFSALLLLFSALFPCVKRER